MRLDQFNNSAFDRGRSPLVEALWLLAQAIFVSSSIPGRWHRVTLLRLFGAKIGRGVVIKPRVRVKFPWRLEIGDFSWIGEDAWIDNLAKVTIGSHSCVSQGVYLCTGSHDWSAEGFDLVVAPILVGDKVWIAAKGVVGPGVEIGSGAVLALGGVATSNLKSNWIHAGVPAKPLRERVTVSQEIKP
jgi:putative colanic acid biosynthesis acetyltransferase WcaF